MVDGRILTEKLIRYALAHLHMSKRDEIYFRNLLLREFKLTDPFEGELDLSYIDSFSVPDELTYEIESYAKENKLCEEFEENLYSAYIFGLLSPLPSVVNSEFNRLKKEKGELEACKYLYDLSVKNNYVQKTAIGRNLWWKFVDGDKFLEITVNLSKPEKDNKEIAKLLTLKKSAKKYPACLLCKENEGFQGTLTHPARENIRTVSLTMGGEPWFIQYSPYAYYKEHLIVISENHTPMHIASDTVEKLLDFVDYLPNYMIGSNAALPIIGGSILNHEHFQGGEHLMPMHLSKVKKFFTADGFDDVEVGIVNWYNNVIRLKSKNRKSISSLTKKIITAWADFTCEECGIFAEADGVFHNSLSPVCRKDKEFYIMDIILRNNITSEEYPDGVFHAHPEYHNIKKEGIGLIEAMGLFILPGRLKKQLYSIAEILAKKKDFDKQDSSLSVHNAMIQELLDEGYSTTIEEAEKRVTDKVNLICKNILFNTAVFKDNKVGKKGFEEFLSTVGIK